MDRLIVYGAGELGGRVARLWRAEGGEVIGFTRTPEHHDALRAAGIETRTNGPAEVLQPRAGSACRLLLSLPGHKTQRAAVERLSHLPPPRRSVLISTVGIYGSEPSGHIDESTRASSQERAQSILETEQRFFDWVGNTGVVLRCGGLYTAGRGPAAALARRGYPRPGPPDKTLTLVHYNDAAQATFAALRREEVESVYNVVSSPCPTRRAFYNAACKIQELPAPDFTERIGDPPAVYDVSLLRRDLLPSPEYPGWQAALRMY